MSDSTESARWNSAERCRIILVGDWPAVVRSPSSVQYPDAEIQLCTKSDRLPPLIHSARADWLLIGEGLDDEDIQRALAGAKAMRENLRLAILGPSHDWRRCERWLRRGCRVYLAASVRPYRAITVLKFAQHLEISVVDPIFFRILQERSSGLTPHLTRREREVLDLLRRGMKNQEIAQALHVTENTVEYHMRHLLAKFGARNRLEVVERATAIGLA